MITLTLQGQTHSKKNQKRIAVNRRTNKSMILSSENYLSWEKAKLIELIGFNPVPTPCIITAVFYRKDRRAFDLSNHWESVADLLVKAGIIPDDNFNHLPDVRIKYGGVDKENPRIELVFEPITQQKAA